MLLDERQLEIPYFDKRIVVVRPWKNDYYATIQETHEDVKDGSNVRAGSSESRDG